MSSDELRWLKFTFIDAAPTVYAEELDAIEFVLTEDVQNLGPVYIAGAKPRLELNPAFLYDQCLAFLIQRYATGFEGANADLFRGRLEACTTLREAPLPCFRRAVVEVFETHPEFGASDVVAAYGQDIRRTRRGTLSAAMFLLAHEAAHVVFRSPQSRYDVREIDEEYEADIFAYMALLAVDDYSFVVYAPFATQSFVDHVSDAELARSHGTSRCRLTRTTQIVERLWPRMTVVRKTIDFYLGNASEVPDLNPDDYIGRLSSDPHFAGPDRGDCDLRVDAALAGVTADLDTVERLLSRSRVRVDVAGEARRLAQALTGADYNTRQGEDMAQSLAVSLLLQTADFQALMSQTQATSSAGNPLGASASAAGAAGEALALFGEEMHTSSPLSAFSAYYSVRSMVEFYSAGRDSDLQQTNRRFLDRLLLIEQLRSSGETISNKLFVARVVGLSPSEFLPTIQVPLIMAQQLVMTGLATGDCDSARYGTSLLDAIGGTQNAAKFDEPGFCEQAGKLIRAEQVRSLGFRE